MMRGRGREAQRGSCWKAFLAACIAALLIPSSSHAQEPEVLVELSRKRIFQGESVRYYVLLNHCDTSVKPTLPVTSGVELRHVRVSMLRQSTFDGFRQTTFGGPRHEYELTPQQSGEIEIPGPSVQVGGKTYQGATLKLEVVPPSEQDLAVIDVTSSKSNVYPLQPFQLRLTVAIKAIPEPYSDKDPLLGVRRIPILQIPWADDKKLPKEISPEIPADRWLNGLLATDRRPIGFAINDFASGNSSFFGSMLPGMLGGNDPFSEFSESGRAIFHPKPQQTKRNDLTGRTVDYWEYTFDRSFTADQIGPMTFGSATLKGSFASKINSAGEAIVEDVYAISKPVVVEVRGAPTEGQPLNYVGAVGRFELFVHLNPTSAKVGDPMTLSLQLRGEGSLENVTPPRLEQTANIGDAFKVYEATEESKRGERTFKYSLRPKKAGMKEFPAIELAYFDYDQERFVNLRTKPISIQVAESDRLSSQDVAMASTGSGANESLIETSSRGIFANITDLRNVRDERVQPDRWFLSLGAMALGFVVFSWVRRHLERQRNDPLQVRRRSAVKRGEAALAEARRQAANGARREAVETLSAALIQLVADTFSKSEKGLTSGDIIRELTAAGVSQAIITRCQQQFAEFDAARYGAAAQSVHDDIESTEQLFSELVRELLQRKLSL